MKSFLGQLLNTLVLATALSAIVFSQSVTENTTGSNQAQANQIAEAIVKMNSSWGEKLNASGAVLKLVETGRANSRITYRLQTEGLPANHIYSLIEWAVTQRQ